MDFFFKFALISYASILFFTMGLRLALFRQMDLNFAKLALIFIVVSISLSVTFIAEPFWDRLFMSLIWTSLIGIGFRFGRKMRQKPSPESKKGSFLTPF